jgi:hypothetical protein
MSIIPFSSFIFQFSLTPNVYYKDTSTEYTEIPADLPMKKGKFAAVRAFGGNFLSYKYFVDHYLDVVRELKFIELLNKVREKYMSRVSKYSHMDTYDTTDTQTDDFIDDVLPSLDDIIDDTTFIERDNLAEMVVSIHFSKNEEVLPISYYETVLYKIMNSHAAPIVFLYFCDKEHNKHTQEYINRLKILCVRNYPKHKVRFIKCPDSVPDHEQLALMAACHHNIISNSKMSWWGAYLNPYKHKQVFAPSSWGTPDLYPTEWVQI